MTDRKEKRMKSEERDFILFGKPTIGEDEIAAVTEVLRSGWIGTGPKCAEFETAFAEYVGAPYARAVSSCTAALHLSLVAAGVREGDEVITTPFTFVATVNAIEHAGAKPVFADIDEQTLNISVREVQKILTYRTRAIIPVHFGGLPCNMDDLLRTGGERVAIIEDAAHAVGARYNHTMIGGIPGSVACFSFYANKNMTTIEGGMVTTDSEEVAREIELLRLHGLDNEAWRRHRAGKQLTFAEAVRPGFKCNMSDVNAAVGLCQLAKLEEGIRWREKHAQIYDEAFSGVPGCAGQWRPESTITNRHALHLYVLVLNPKRFTTTRDELVQEMRDHGIGATVHYRAVHHHAQFHDDPRKYPVSVRMSKNIFTLPLQPSMTEEEVGYVATTVREIIERHQK
jgi:dTDP-4-amino-4,6-dideoxygalactose transaminase